MASRPPSPLYNHRAVAAVALIFGAVEMLVAARFVGKMFGAREDLALVQVIYQVSAPLAAPFWAIFGQPRFTSTLTPHCWRRWWSTA